MTSTSTSRATYGSSRFPARGATSSYEFVARLREAPLGQDRPPWEFWVVEGLAGDRVALVPKVSHVLDGMAILAGPVDVRLRAAYA